MVKTIIGGIDVQKWITNYRVDNPPIYGNNGFVDISGVEIQDKLGDKITIQISMADIPTPIAVQLATILQADSIPVDYTTPAPASNIFKKTSYSTVCCDANPDESDYEITDGILWEIDVTLESLDYNTAHSSGGL